MLRWQCVRRRRPTAGRYSRSCCSESASSTCAEIGPRSGYFESLHRDLSGTVPSLPEIESHLPAEPRIRSRTKRHRQANVISMETPTRSLTTSERAWRVTLRPSAARVTDSHEVRGTIDARDRRDGDAAGSRADPCRRVRCCGPARRGCPSVSTRAQARPVAPCDPRSALSSHDA